MNSNNSNNFGNGREKLFGYWKIHDIDLSGRNDKHFSGYVMIPHALFSYADELGVGGMQSSLFILLIYLISRGYSFCGYCNPSHRQIADDLKVSVNTIERNLKKLSDLGLITVEQRNYKEKALTNHYSWFGLFDKLRLLLIRDGFIKP